MIKRLLCTMLLLFLLAGCAEKEEKEEASFTMSGNETLLCVEYSTSNGMMRGCDFSIKVTPEKICSAYIFAERELEYLSLEDTAITAAQWEEINNAVLVFAPLLREIEPSPEKSETVYPFIQPLDGINSSSFYLTWETAEGEVRVHYEIPSDMRFHTLLDILRETADPIGREIVYYEAPVLTGLYFHRESLLQFNRYSYQCTVKGEGTDERYFCAYYYEGGPASYNATVYVDTWRLIEEKCAELGIEKLDTASADRKPICTLYYSDQTQRKVVLDRSDAEELKDFFDQLVAELKEETE